LREARAAAKVRHSNVASVLHLGTESLTDLRPTEWPTILAKLRRAKLLAREDTHNPGQLDTHPLVREYFGEQLRSQQTGGWKECNRRLYHYYRTLAPQLPESFAEMEPLFLAVICGCAEKAVPKLMMKSVVILSVARW
jgi:hypothetical protein